MKKNLNLPHLNTQIKWKCGEVLAEGGSSVVYKAFNIENGSIFVIKKFHSSTDQKLLDAFQVIINY